MNKIQTPQNTIKRTFHFMTPKKHVQKTQKVGDILLELGFTKVGTGKSTLSINHEDILYK